MKNKFGIRIRVFLAVVTIFCSSLDAQTDFFFSFQNLGRGVANAEPTRTYNAGDIGFLYLYYTTNGPIDSNIDLGAFLDIQTSVSGVIRFTFAETLNFEILQGNEFRWCDTNGLCGSWGEPGTVSDDQIDELGAFVITDGPGIREENDGTGSTLDAGYDIDADAFLFARINFVVLDEPGPDGTSVDIFASPGAGGIVNDGELVKPTFGMATAIIDSIPKLIGDVNCDGEINLLDVAPFVAAITNGEFDPKADVNQDGAVDLLDVAPFVALLTG